MNASGTTASTRWRSWWTASSTTLRSAHPAAKCWNAERDSRDWDDRYDDDWDDRYDDDWDDRYDDDWDDRYDDDWDDRYDDDWDDRYDEWD